MSHHTRLKPLSIALGAAFASALSVGNAAAANPFGQTELTGGYLLAENTADKAKLEGKCGEGKCGAMNKAPMQPGNAQGGAKPKAMQEGMCGAMGKAQKQGDKAATPETPDNAVKPE